MVTAETFVHNEPVTFGDPEGCIGVITLSTGVEAVVKQLTLAGIAFVGQLHSKGQGINALIRNCLRHPQIRYLVVAGDDAQGSGQALIHLFLYGMDEGRRIRRSPDALLDSDIHEEAITRLRRYVQVMDRRNVTDFEKLDLELSTLPPLPAYERTPQSSESANEPVGHTPHGASVHTGAPCGAGLHDYSISRG